MRLTFSGLSLLTLLLTCSPLFADTIGTTSLTGRYDGPNVAACSGTTACQASSTITINPPDLGPTPMTAGINAMASFSGPFVYNPNDPGAAYGLDGTLIPAGSYLLNGQLNTFQGASFGLYSQQQNPDVRLAAAFNLPAGVGNVHVHAFFEEGGDANQIPADNLVIVTPQATYSLAKYYCYGPNTCAGTPSADFTVLHNPATSSLLNFYADSSAFYNGTDSANFQVILTGADLPLSDTPEPGTLALLVLSLAGLAFWRVKRVSRCVQHS